MVMLDSQFFRFSDGVLLPCSDAVSEVKLAAADSFLVEDGRVRSLPAHEERFRNWVFDASPEAAKDLDGFLSQVRSALPTEGRWFPRLELHLNSESAGGASGLFLRLRVAPEQLGEISLWTLPEADPRTVPKIKGPDLSLCMQLRRKAQLHGADEAVLLDSVGYLSEGALSSIVWWRSDVLCAPDSQSQWLHSITRDEVFEIAKSLGYQTRLEHVKPADLVGTEVWALSSLQGIRPVSQWVNLGSPLATPVHLEKFQRRLRLFASSVS